MFAVGRIADAYKRSLFFINCGVSVHAVPVCKIILFMPVVNGVIRITDGMDKLKMISYYVGIGITISLFVILIISIGPHLFNGWDDGDLGSEEVLALMQAEPTYQAMYERYPDAVEIFSFSDHGNAEMNVGKRNPETGSSLVLSIYVYGDGTIRPSVNCDNGDGSQPEHVRDLFAEEFIRTADCVG